jgi:hypothetical protein
MVAQQFLPKVDGCNEVDHLSRDRTDNRLENLRWCSHSLNTRNRKSHLGVKYEYLDELPEGYELFTQYEMQNGKVRFFNNLYMKMDNNQPQFITDNSEHQFRRLYKHKNRDSVAFRDTDGKPCHIYFSRITQTQNKISDTQNGINTTQQQINITQQMLIETINKLIDTIAEQK